MQNDVATSIGLLNFYGMSPALDLTQHAPEEAPARLTVLLNGTCDLRHAIKTLTDHCIQPGGLEEIHFYIRDKDMENIARDIVMLEVVNNSKLAYRERSDIFFDVYWNCFMRQKTQDYLDERIAALQGIVCDGGKCPLGVKELWDFKNLKYRDQDKLVEIFGRWASKVPFDIEKYRDDRQRHLFQDRYDHRKNLYDWDYIWGIKPIAPILHPREYKDWREKGVAFEVRTATYVVPNRTMAAYVEGNRKDNRNSCIVLGFWGDMIVSPFFTLGVDTSSEPEKTKLFRIKNKHHMHISQHIAEFNSYASVYQLERLEEYHLNWDKEDKIKTEDTKKEMEALKKKKEMESIKEEEVVEEEMEEMEEGGKEAKQVKEIEKSRGKGGERQNLISIEEKTLGGDQTETSPDNEGVEGEQPLQQEDNTKGEESDISNTLDEGLVAGLSQIKIKFLPISDPLSKFGKKKKYQGLFDIVAQGLLSALDLKDENFTKILKPGARIFQENAHFLVPLELKKRPIANNNMLKDLPSTLVQLEASHPSHFAFRYTPQQAIENETPVSQQQS